MASPGLLLLMLVSSSLLLLSAVSGQPPPANSQLQKFNVKERGEKIRKVFHQIRELGVPFLGLIPGCGQIISAVASLILGLIPQSNEVLNALQAEFESLNIKLDNYHRQQRWDIWAAGAFHIPQKDIEEAWTEYGLLVPLFAKATGDEKQSLSKKIFDACSKAQDAFRDLHAYMTAQEPTFINNLASMLADHARCHEKDIREYTVLLSQLIYKGNALTQLCYKLHNIESQELVNDAYKMAHESASAMAQIHRHCISNSIEYIKKDVEELIDDTQQHQDIADTVRAQLAKMFDRYDWMVVAFTTKNSNHKRRRFNKHTISSEFTVVSRGEVSVAVVGQVRGNHIGAGRVKQVIAECVRKSVECHKVIDVLKECEPLENMQAYTAVHAFIDHSQTSLDATAVGSGDRAEEYIYVGECHKSRGIKGGLFVVMIKSDEEMRSNYDPCRDLKCGGARKGKCVRVENTLLAMCECYLPYYGVHCEETLEGYKPPMIEVTDSRTPRQG